MRDDWRTFPYAAVFAEGPAPMLVLDANLVVQEANRAYVSVIGRPREDLIGRYMFDLFPLTDDPAGYGMAPVRASLERARDTRRPETMDVQRYDIPVVGGGFEERYWSPIHVPILDEDGRTVLLLHRAEDVTEFVQERQRAQGERERGRPGGAGWRTPRPTCSRGHVSCRS